MKKPSETDKLNPVFSKYTEIEAVYLFRSVASGKETKRSDLDLGIVYNQPSITTKKVDLYTELVKAGFEDTDIVLNG